MSESKSSQTFSGVIEIKHWVKIVSGEKSQFFS